MAKEIIVPKGWEIDKIENGKIILKEIKDKYPKTWKECAHQLNDGEFIDNDSCIYRMDTNVDNISECNENLLPAGYGKKMLALCQLLICRNTYWGNWRPKLSNTLYTITCGVTHNKIVILKPHSIGINRILCFPTPGMRDEFYKNFKDLIEEAKELL